MSQLKGKLTSKGTLHGHLSASKIAEDYEKLKNLPLINGVTLIGDQTSEDLGITEPVNADWEAVDGLAKILNKPTIPAAQVNSDWNAVDGVAKILNKPTIPAAQIQSDWNQTDDGVVDYIKNKPTIPAAQVNSDWEASDGVAKILNKPVIYTQDEVNDIIDGLLPIDEADGSVASFSTDLAKPLVSLKADVDAIQDLHGANGAYPAGGGKNIFPVKDVTTVSGITITIRDDGGLLINGTAASSFNATVKSDLKADTYILSCRYIGTPPTEGAARAQIYHQASGLSYQISNPDPTNMYKTVTVSEDLTNVEFRIRITGGYNYVNVIYYPQLESGSTLTAFTPYENIRPIYGWNSINIVKSKKNLFDYDENKVSSGETTTATIRSYYPLDIHDVTLTFSAKLKEGATTTGSDYLNVGSFIGSSGLLELQTSFITPDTITTRTRTFSGDKFPVLMSLENPVTIKSILSRYDIQIEIGSLSTDYESYNGQTITIPLNDTIYGGELAEDADGHRRFKITHKKYVFNGTEVWTQYSEHVFFTLALSDALYTDGVYIKCSNYIAKVSTTGSDITNNYPNCSCCFQSLSLYKRFYIKDNNLTLNNIQSQTTGITVIYPLATPTVIDLSDGTPITTLIGTNNIFADSGDVEVKFKKSIQKYIDDKIAETQALIL